MENEIKPLTKKELIKRIEEYKPKYIYQRYDGRIHKYEVVNDNYLVETKTGMSFDFRSHLMLGKVSEDILDLIKVEDVIKIKTGQSSDMHIIKDEGDIIYLAEQMQAGLFILDKIYTKEMMESISYKVTKM